MKKRRQHSSDHMQSYFVICTFAILCISLGVSALITILIEFLTRKTVSVPNEVWMILISVVLGTIITMVTSRFFLSPITRLSRAMSQVAEGDFSVQLSMPEGLGEMHTTYANFNTMVRALAATETLQSDFISNVSHEFKTPITAIEGYAMLLQDAAVPPELQAEYIDKILFSTRRLSELVNNILLLSKVDNQQIPGEKRSFRLDEQLRKAVLMLERKWTDKQIELDVDLDPVTFTGNEILMLHVWTNLIDNAIKFDKAGGMVRLRLHGTDDTVTVEVSDNGPGIPPEQLEHIFDRFYQADDSHKSEGNGLGLALVRRIVHLCGGEITVRSVVNEGSTFLVTLPIDNS